jgi:hypothetical protein
MILFDNIKEDIEAVFQRDPAVRSKLEVVLCYPGFHAVQFHRLKRAQNGVQSGHLFRMTGRGYMIKTRIMCHKCCAHISPLWFENIPAGGKNSLSSASIRGQHISLATDGLQIPRLLWINLDLATQTGDLNINSTFLRLATRS